MLRFAYILEQLPKHPFFFFFVIYLNGPKVQTLFSTGAQSFCLVLLLALPKDRTHFCIFKKKIKHRRSIHNSDGWITRSLESWRDTTQILATMQAQSGQGGQYSSSWASPAGGGEGKASGWSTLLAVQQAWRRRRREEQWPVHAGCVSAIAWLVRNFQDTQLKVSNMESSGKPCYGLDMKAHVVKAWSFMCVCVALCRGPIRPTRTQIPSMV